MSINVLITQMLEKAFILWMWIEKLFHLLFKLNLFFLFSGFTSRFFVSIIRFSCFYNGWSLIWVVMKLFWMDMNCSCCSLLIRFNLYLSKVMLFFEILIVCLLQECWLTFCYRYTIYRSISFIIDISYTILTFTEQLNFIHA